MKFIEPWSSADFDVLLFSDDPVYAAAAEAAGCAGVIVDWEQRGKGARQIGFDTEISAAGPAELQAMRSRLHGRLLCRINNAPVIRVQEARAAVDLGADEVWLPMVRSLHEIDDTLNALQGRADLGIVVETGDAMRLAPALARLPIKRVYIGLNDLRIDLGHRDLFTPLVDGTVDAFRDGYDGPMGVAGVTLPAGGDPVPQALLLAAMARLQCRFGVARRTFRRELPVGSIADGIAAIGRHYQVLSVRTPAEVSEMYVDLRSRIAGAKPVDAFV